MKFKGRLFVCLVCLKVDVGDLLVQYFLWLIVWSSVLEIFEICKERELNIYLEELQLFNINKCQV